LYYCSNPNSLNYMSQDTLDLIRERSSRLKFRNNCFYGNNADDQGIENTTDEAVEAPKENTNTQICSPYLQDTIGASSTNDPEEVRKLQRFLNDNLSLNLDVDGTYDQDDVEAVKIFQSKYKTSVLEIWGLSEPTGYVGRTTRLKINSLNCAKTQVVQCPAFTNFNSRTTPNNGAEVERLQRVLTDLDLYSGPISGVYGNQTIASVIRFQETFRATMLKPWGLTKGTGYKYKTTNKFLNELSGCVTSDLVLENGKTVSY